VELAILTLVAFIALRAWKLRLTVKLCL